MSRNTTRRAFVKASSSSIAAITSGLPFMFGLPKVSADEAKMKSNLVELSGDIEPLVQLIETTSRDELLERVAERIRAGSSYREVLAALFLAGIRNVQPYPLLDSSFIVSWSSMRAISQAVRGRTKIAGCRFSGHWTISNLRSGLNQKIAAGECNP